MSKAEKFINDNTRNDSNIAFDASVGHIIWITPNDAKKAVEIAREEMIERAIKWVEYNNENGGCKFDGWVEDFKQAMTK